MTTWRCSIEIEFPALVSDVTPQTSGDTEMDYSGRAMDRLRPALERMRASLGPGVVWRVVDWPGREGQS